MTEISTKGKLFKSDGVIVGLHMGANGDYSPVIRSGGKYYAMDYFSPSYDTCMDYIRGHTGVSLFHNGNSELWAVSATDGRNILKMSYKKLGLKTKGLAKGSYCLHNLGKEFGVVREKWKIR